MPAEYQALEIDAGEKPKLADVDDSLGYWAVVFTVTNGMIGPVILVVPYSFFLIGLHGWTMYVFAFFMFYFTGHLLFRAQISQRGKPYQSYPEIGEGLLGTSGRTVVGTSMIIELLGLCAAFVVIVGDNLVKVQPLASIGIELSKSVWIIVFAITVLPSVLIQNYTILAEMSKIGVIVCFSIPLIVMLSSIVWPVNSYYTQEEIAIEGSSFQYENLPLAMGIVSVAYTTHAIFPSVVARMKDTTQFPSVMKISFGVVTLFYLFAGVGFYLYGKATDPQITFNLPPQSQTWISYAIILTILLKFALMLNPVILELEEAARARDDLRQFFCVSSTKSAEPIIALRVLLVVATIAVALMVPYIALIHSVVGVFWSVFVCVVVPCMLGLALGKSITHLENLAAWALLILGLIVMFVGLYQNLQQIHGCYTNSNEFENMCN
ncbi:hypothetical protein AAMO2058_001421000 [Amorphochlora amoebiformis]|mmetsp:Transcript_2893/g.4406  ORF Transcript_2893/g.4406 Transcript_2893/m.4406 type:complete len:436 (-) Transcript_2893:444-1751(-)